MLDALKRITKNTKKLDENRFIKKALDNTQIQHDILELNRTDQLYNQGITADGKSLGGYSPFTIQYKVSEAGRLGRDTRIDHITLKDTGAFYDSFTFKNSADEFIIRADTVKDGEDLVEREGEILGLTEANKSEVAGWIKRDIIRQTLETITGR